MRSGTDGGDITGAPAQTAAITQPSKSYYHRNGTDGGGGEEMGVCDEVEGHSLFLSTPLPFLFSCLSHTHTLSILLEPVQSAPR